MQWELLPQKLLRRQVAATAGKKRSTSVSLFLEAYGLAVEAELSTMATPTWAEGAWIGNWHTEQEGSMGVPVGFVPSAFRRPRVKLCGPRYSERPVQQGKRPLMVAEWREIVERKAHRGRSWNMSESEQCMRGMLEYFTRKEAWAETVLADAAKGKQEGVYKVGGSRSLQRSSEASQGKCGYGCNAPMMRRAYNARKSGKWESFKVASEDIGRLSIAQEVLRKSADFLMRIIAREGIGGVTLLYVCPQCDCFPPKDSQ